MGANDCLYSTYINLSHPSILPLTTNLTTANLGKVAGTLSPSRPWPQRYQLQESTPCPQKIVPLALLKASPSSRPSPPLTTALTTAPASPTPTTRSPHTLAGAGAKRFA